MPKPMPSDIRRRTLIASALGGGAIAGAVQAEDVIAPSSGGAFSVGLFETLHLVSPPKDCGRVLTTGFRKNGVGAASYRLTPQGPTTPYRRQSADGRWWQLDETSPNVLQVGAALDGVSNDTGAFLAAKDALPNGAGVVIVPPGIARLNLLIDFSGVTFRGSGHGKSRGAGPPIANYWRASDPTRPVVQFGDDKAIVEGSFIEDVCLYGGGKDEYGIRMAGGSRLNGARRFTITGFSKANLSCRGGSARICCNNRFSDFSINAGVHGSIAIELHDAVSSDAQFCNDQQFENGYVVTSPGAKALVNDSSWAVFVNMKFDVREGALHFKSTVAKSRIYGNAETQFDASRDDIAVLVEGKDLVSSGAGFGNPIEEVRLDGRILASQVKTKGSMAAGSDMLSVENPGGFSAGRHVLIYAESHYFGSVVKAVRGNSITLSRPAPIAVVKADVHVGDLVEATRPGSSLRVFDPDGSRYGSPALQPLLRGTNGAGPAGTPYNGYGLAWELGGKPLWILCETHSGVGVQSVARAGGILSIRIANAGGAAVGDFLVLRGANEEGINEEILAVASVEGDTITAQTSPAAPDVAAASGAIKAWLIKPLRIQRGVPVHPRGAGLTVATAFGDSTLLSWKATGLLHVADPAEGHYVIDFGDKLAGAAGEVFGLAPQGSPKARALTLNGGGGLALASNANPFAKPSLLLADSKEDPAGPIEDGAILLYSNGAEPRIKTGATPPATLSTKVGPPASATAPGKPGQWAADTAFLYVCVSDAAWRRTPLSDW